MLRIIDNTLTALDQDLPAKADLHTFCEMLFTIGVDEIELSTAAYERMEHLSDQRRFILYITKQDEMAKYPGFYRYICREEEYADSLIPEIQVNDVREIIKLRGRQGFHELRIIGLDDLLCHDYDKIMNEIKNVLPLTKIIFCPENTLQCASALAIHWLMEFGKDVTTSFAGCKNNAATEEVIMAMRLAVRYKPNRNLTFLPRMTQLYEKFMNRPVCNKKPIIGKRIFQVEAGIHADGMMKNPVTYEAYNPSCVGQQTELIIGKHSGTSAIKMKLEELGLSISNEALIEKILSVAKEVSTEYGKSLSNEEFTRLVTEVAAFERSKTYS